MTDLPLDQFDIQEILSSLFLAELSYDARQQHAEGASLVPDFVPTQALLPKLDSVADTVRAVFNVPLEIATLSSPLSHWAEVVEAEWRDSEHRITFFTSGSTGTPKPTTHHMLVHVQEVLALAGLFKGRKRIVSLVPRHHIYGFLFSILLPKAMQVPVCWEVPLPTPGLVAALQPGDLLVAFPLLWGKLMEMNIQFGNDIHGATSTGPCPPRTIATLKENGLARMYEIYGSSETGGIGTRHDTASGYTLLQHWQRTDDPGTLLRHHPVLGEQNFSLQDVLNWNEDTFLPMRRTDNAVQVAGVNVHPSHVRATLNKHPDVSDCAVRLMRPEEGNRLKAFIIPSTSLGAMTELESNLRKWAKAHLSPSETPISWTFGKKLPVNAMGKLADW